MTSQKSRFAQIFFLLILTYNYIEENTIYFIFLASIVGAWTFTNLDILFVVLPVKVVYTKVLYMLHVKRVKLLERDKNVHDKTRMINL